KPFACGIVLHPVIDGCIELRNEHQLLPGMIERIDVRSNPLALDLAGKKSPMTGLEGKLSVYHAAAVALNFGKAGVREFTDDCVNDPDVIALRQRVVTHADATVGAIEAHVGITLKDGRRIEKHVLNAIGTLERPMTDADLEAKFMALAEASHSQRQARDVVELAWRLDTLSDAAQLVRATARERVAAA
ncbi:MAG TPA: MmgE/PrpD family protein, partial [Burkholderiales bacterium]|nr:MmgE/PrpD family protein [Burkholderiales bacterium]